MEVDLRRDIWVVPEELPLKEMFKLIILLQSADFKVGPVTAQNWQTEAFPYIGNDSAGHISKWRTSRTTREYIKHISSEQLEKQLIEIIKTRQT